MSITRVGYAGDRDKVMRPLVMLNLSDPEREALARVLAIAEAHLDEIPFPVVRGRRRIAELLVCDLRLALDLPEVKPQRDCARDGCVVGCPHDPGDGHSAAGYAANH